jgi:predicted translin family RNA/ssDNA-binding protein
MVDAIQPLAMPGIDRAEFEKIRDELDEHHDRRERVVKISRDITALAKKM